MQVKFRIPEILFGALLAVAVFAMGFLAASSTATAPPNDSAAEHKADTKSTQSHQAKSLWVPEDSTAFFTIWIAGFTGVLAIGTLFLWNETKKAANAARSAAEALPRLERAYVFFISTTSSDFVKSLEFISKESGAFKLKYKFKNSGRTPAILKRIQIGAEYLETGFPTNIEFTYGDGDLPSPLIVGADQSPPESDAQVRMNGSDYDKAKAGNGRIFFWGKLTYLDVFGASHETGICSEWHFGQSRFVISKCDELNYYT